jgi:HK97 gp10 family phage protein
MAKVKQMKLPDEFQEKLAKLGNKTDEIIPRVLDAGGEVVANVARNNLQSAIGRGTKLPSRSTGQLLSALGVSRARQDRNGNYNVKVGFAENRRDGRPNGLIANVLEHGRHNQPPRPFMRPARTQSRKGAIEAMKNTFESEVGKL